MLYYTLRLWVGSILNLHVCSFGGCFWWMIFNSVKEISRLLKEINKLSNKGMPNIYLKVTIDRKWHNQNFDFRTLKSLTGAPTLNFCSTKSSPCFLLNKNLKFN